MGPTNITAVSSERRAIVSPWLIFGAAMVVCWGAMIRHHLADHGSGHVSGWWTIAAMWSLMSVAMMAPTAIPVLAALRDVLSSSSIRPWWAFLGGYLAIWLGFSVVAAAAQMWLVDLHLIGHDGSSSSHVFSAALLAIAGAYQFSSLKRRCATECVHPMTFFFQHWRDGIRGGARMGLRHGLSCLGCCWALMLLAFVGGVASVWFMVLAAVVMAAEKLPSMGRFVSAPLGVCLLIASVVVVVLGGRADHPAPSHHHLSIGLPDRTKGTQ